MTVSADQVVALSGWEVTIIHRDKVVFSHNGDAKLDVVGYDRPRPGRTQLMSISGVSGAGGRALR